MAEKVALVIVKGQSVYPIVMSEKRALLAKGAEILTVVNRPKGEPRSKKLFYNKDGTFNEKARRGMDSPSVNISKEDKKWLKKHHYVRDYDTTIQQKPAEPIIKPKPRGGDILRPVDVLPSEGTFDSGMPSKSPPGDSRELWLARSKEATEAFKEQNQGKPSGIETGLTNLYNMTVDWLRDNNRGALSRLDALVKLNEEEGIPNPQASAVRDFMLTDSSSIFSDQRKNPQSALTRAFGLDSEGTGVIRIPRFNQGQDSSSTVPSIRITGGQDEQPKAPTKKQKGTPITNRDLRDYYDNIERIQSGPITGETVMIEGSDEIYGGATGKSWQEYSKAWQKANKENIKAGMPEDPIKSLFKKATSKKGGGRVSSRPKSYRTAKVMKQYSKGGSVRKPKRI